VRFPNILARLADDEKGLSVFMERSVKERVVGATILVVLLVLIVPELLSGPKSPATARAPALPASDSTESMRNVTVDLTTRRATAADGDTAAATAAAASAADTESASAASADSEPGSPPNPTPGPSSNAPTITTLKAQQPSDAPPVENEAPSPRSSMAAKAVTTHEASHGGWAVQLGSFASRVNADNLVRQLKGREAPAYVLSSGKGADQRYKVRVGPVADRAAAERLRLKLAKDGHAGSLVAP
jgi:cell division septation protein DedD